MVFSKFSEADVEGINLTSYNSLEAICNQSHETDQGNNEQNG